MILEPEQFDGTARHIRELPGGDEMCARITGSLSADSETRTEHDNSWLEIGIALTYCTAFPVHEFTFLAEAGEFDVRWPLTFACWYWGASGASVDSHCAKFIQHQNLVEPARATLCQYSGEFVSKWREDFVQQLTSCST